MFLKKGRFTNWWICLSRRLCSLPAALVRHTPSGWVIAHRKAQGCVQAGPGKFTVSGRLLLSEPRFSCLLCCCSFWLSPVFAILSRIQDTTHTFSVSHFFLFLAFLLIVKLNCLFQSVTRSWSRVSQSWHHWCFWLDNPLSWARSVHFVLYTAVLSSFSGFYPLGISHTISPLNLWQPKMSPDKCPSRVRVPPAGNHALRGMPYHWLPRNSKWA